MGCAAFTMTLQVRSPRHNMYTVAEEGRLKSFANKYRLKIVGKENILIFFAKGGRLKNIANNDRLKIVGK